MTTTIEVQAQGKQMENIFENCNVFSIRTCKALGIKDNDYDPTHIYTYEITMRHDEGTSAKKLFKKELSRISK